MRNSQLSGTGEIVPQLQLEVALARAKELLDSTRKIFLQQPRVADSVYKRDVEKDFKQVEDLLNAVEPGYVSDKQAQRLALALIVDLPEWFSGYMEKITELGIYKANGDPWVTRRRDALVRNLHRAINEQPTLRVRYSMLEATQRAQAIASKPQADAARAERLIEFPAAPWISKEFSARWERLSHQWRSAYHSATTVEDQFRLEQLASVHLPDSLNMFAALADAEPEVQAEAKELLAQQLGAAERQIQISSQRYSKDAITALRAQSAFMQEIGQLPRSSALLLTADDA